MFQYLVAKQVKINKEVIFFHYFHKKNQAVLILSY